jgi:hypothetical protein
MDQVSQLTMLAFQPRAGLSGQFINYLDDPDAVHIFQSILEDPYILVEFALSSWYRRVEYSAKETTRRVSSIAEVCTFWS